MLSQLVAVLLVVGAGNTETTLIPPPFSHDLGFHRASKFYLDMYLGRDFQFNDPEGLAAEKLRAEDDTTTSADDHILMLFAVNSGAGQILYNAGMRKIGLYGEPGSGPGQFSNAHGIAVNRAGDIYIADTDNNRVVRLFYTRKGLEFVTAWPGFGHPYGVAMDSKGQVYVTELDSSRVIVLDSMGKQVATWTGLDQPTGIAVIDAGASYNFFGEDCAVVIDRNGQRLSRWRLNGELLGAIDARAIGLNNAGFSYCALDYYANVYVTDRLNDEVHKFDRTLTYLASFGRTGSKEGEFHSPRGITIGRRFGQVFVAEEEGGQYYWIGLDAYMLGCYPDVLTRDQTATTIALYTTEVADLTITVVDRKSRIVRNLYPGENREKAGELLVVWDGRDNFGALVGPGEYTVRVLLKPTYGGSRRVFKKELTAKVKKV